MAEITESKNFIHAFIEEDIAEGGQFAGSSTWLVVVIRVVSEVRGRAS